MEVNVDERRIKKSIFICRIVTIFSAILYFIFVVFLVQSSKGDMKWTYGLEYLLKAIGTLLNIGVFLPPFLILYFRNKIKSSETEDRIKKLEQEIERLKKK